MTSLERIIKEKIKQDGHIPFETFMEMALYHPGIGYYTSPEIKIGKKGDFYTSPHLHPIFGIMIGRQLEEMWEFMKSPSDFYVVEIGAGAGYLCKDLLEYLRDREIFNSLNYIIVELNPAVIENQKNILADFLEKIKWVSSLTGLNKFRGCVFSNELLDAFPVHIIEMEDKMKEIYVTFDDNKFVEQKLDVSLYNLLKYLKEFNIVVPVNYRTEINLRIKDWLKEISSVLSEGFLFTIDYGYTAKEYYSDERKRGTLLCYHEHGVTENPYKQIGRQDITAHVNFSSLKLWGEGFGFKTIGYCPQGIFLIALGIDEVITELYSGSPTYESEILKIKGLILPQGMGESHKVMIQYKGEGMPNLRGFSIRNQIKSL